MNLKFKNILIFLFLLVTTQNCFAVDVNNDGYDDIFIFYPDTQLIEAYKSSGEFISSAPLPFSLIGAPAIVFSGIQDKKLAIYSILVNGNKANGILYKIDSEGTVSSKLIGELKSSTLMFQDINKDGNSDLIIVHKSGKVVIHHNVLGKDEFLESRQTQRLLRNSQVVFSRLDNIPYLTYYTHQKKKRKTTFKFHSLQSNHSFKEIKNKKFKKQLIFHNAPGVHFTEHQKNKKGVIKSMGHLNFNTDEYKKHKLIPSSSIVPGTYLENHSDLQVFSVSKTGKVLDFSNSLNIISELDLEGATKRQASILSHPYFSFKKNSVKTQQSGCTYSQDGNDGPGGFLLKRSDHDLKLVILLPNNLSTTNTVLTTFRGDIIEDLKFTGRSNGFRETHRGSKAPTAYPKELIVKAIVGTNESGQEQSVCYKIYNSHSRND